jgi:large subunit ribosomal protein L21
MVYAIIRTGGKQHRVSVGDRVDVEKLPIETGNTVEIDQVLAVGEGENLQVGSPTLAGAKVVCEVVRQDRARKVLVGKYKKRKGYYRKNGHRQSFTRLRVDSILAEGMEKAASAVAAEESVEEETQ